MCIRDRFEDVVAAVQDWSDGVSLPALGVYDRESDLSVAKIAVVSASELSDGDLIVMTEVSNDDTGTLSFGRAAVGAWDWPAGDAFAGSRSSDDRPDVDVGACVEGDE